MEAMSPTFATLLALTDRTSTEAYRQGESIGRWIVPFLLLLGIGKCVQVMRRPTASTMGVGSLLLLLLGMALSAVATTLSAQEIIPRKAAFFLVIPNFLMIPGAFILGIVALATYDRTRFRQGRAQAIWTICLSSLIGIGMCVTLAQTFLKNSGEETASPEQAQTISEPEFNFTFTPPAGWRKMNPDAFNSIARFMLRKSGPDTFVAIIPEHPGMDLKVEALREISIGKLNAETRILSQTESLAKVGRLDFLRVVSHVRLKSPDVVLCYEHWFYSRQGFCWQFMFWSTDGNGKILGERAAELMSSFRLLDPERDGLAEGTFKEVDLPAFGLRTRLAGKGWDILPSGEWFDPQCAFEARKAADHIFAMPVLFTEKAPDLAALKRAFLTKLNLKHPDEGAYEERPWNPGPQDEGVEIIAHRPDENGAPATLLLRISRRENSACMTGSWAATAKEDRDRFRRNLDLITQPKPVGAAPADSRERKRSYELFLNTVGVSYYLRENFPEAVSWFALAFNQTKSDGPILGNWVDSLQKSEKPAEALALLRAHRPFLEKKPSLLYEMARLQVGEGDIAGGQATFLELIGRDYQEEQHLLDWVNLLNNKDKETLGADAINAWVARHPSVKTRVWQAQQVYLKGSHDESITLFEKLAAEFPEDDSVACNLGEHYNKHGDHAKAAEISSRLLARKKSVRAGMILGWSHMGRKWYRDAKEAFEAAAKTGPETDEIRSAIREASALLGQGDNSSIKTPIEPVSLPSSLASRLGSDPVPAAWEKDQTAIWLLRATGWQHTKGARTRHTLHRRVRILDSEAATSFSTVEVGFNPLNERIFMNRMEVRDSSGAVVSRASVSDAYVRDQGGDTASNRKVLHIQVPGVQPGRTVEWEITWEDLDPSPLDFERHIFASGLPSLVDTLFFVGDIPLMRFESTGGPALEEIREDRLAAWINRRREASPSEPLAVMLEERCPAVWFGSDHGGWDRVTRDYLADIRDRLEPDPALVKLSAELTRDCADDRAKLAAIARHVQKEVGYKAIEFGVRARRPNAPAETLRLRYGDCKDMALLLHHLLRAAGVTSHLALVNTDWTIRPGLPNLDQFNHMVVHVPGLGAGWLVDATDKTLDLAGFPANNLWHTHALLLDAEKPRLLDPPAPPRPEACRLSLSRTASIEEGAWKVEETVNAAGYYASYLRSSFTGLSTEQQFKNAQEILARMGNVRLQSCTFDDLNDTSKPAVLHLGYTIPGALKNGSAEPGAVPPSFWETDYLGTTFVKDRHTAYLWNFPLDLTSQVTLRVPGPLTPASISSFQQEAASDYCSWKLQPLALSPRELQLRFSFKAGVVRKGPETYHSFHEAWEKARLAWDKAVTWGK